MRQDVERRKRILGLAEHERFVPQSYDWGVEAQVGWYEAYVDLDGERTKLQVFSMRSMASGAAFHRAYLSSTQQAFLEAHELAFAYLRESSGDFVRFCSGNKIVENARGHPAEIGEGSHMAFQKSFGRLGWKRHHEAVVGVRQIHRQIMGLPLHAGNDYQRFAEVCLRLACRVPQRHEHLPAMQRRRTHIVLHDGVAAAEPVFFSEPIKIRFAVCRCLAGRVLSSSRMASITPPRPASGAAPPAAAGSPAVPSSAASSPPTLAISQTPALPPVDFAPQPEPLAVPAHRAPPYTSLRCSMNPAACATAHGTQSRRWPTFTPPRTAAYAALHGLVLHRRSYHKSSSIKAEKQHEY